MLERKRKAKGYGLVPQDGGDGALELGGPEGGLTGEDGAEDSTDGDGRLTPSSGADGEGHDGGK